MESSGPSNEEDFQDFSSDGRTTGSSLLRAIHEVPTDFKPLPLPYDVIPDSPECYRLQQEISCDEVYPGIIIGDRGGARNKEYLTKIGVTHVLNASEERRLIDGSSSNQKLYKGTQLKYLGLQLADLPSTDISQYFYMATAFIKDALNSGGKVYVHCIMGVSRSATIVIAYLMIEKHMSAVEAIKEIRKSRPIHPNDGFLRQLAILDNQLRQQRLRKSYVHSPL